MGRKEILGGSLVFRWVRESLGRATGLRISRGASRPGCVLVSFLFHATFVARNLLPLTLHLLPVNTVSVRARRPLHRPPPFALRRAPAAAHCPRSALYRCHRPSLSLGMSLTRVLTHFRSLPPFNSFFCWLSTAIVNGNRLQYSNSSASLYT